MDLGELKNLTADWLDDGNFGYFTASKVTEWINNAQKKVQMLLVNTGNLRYVVKSKTTLVANQSDYVLPDDFMKENRLVIVQNIDTASEVELPILPITLNEQNFVSEVAAIPQFFYIKKGRFVLLPEPDTAYTLRLYYSYRVADLALDIDEPDIPEEYHELLAIEAAHTGLIKDKQDVTSLLEKKREFLKLYADDATSQINDSPRMVVYSDEY